MSVIECPNCGISIEVLEINCRIFRCGVLKENMQQIPPHSSKEECDNFVKEDLIYGCGKPFQLVMIENEWKPIICDYI